MAQEQEAQEVGGKVKEALAAVAEAVEEALALGEEAGHKDPLRFH